MRPLLLELPSTRNAPMAARRALEDHFGEELTPQTAATLRLLVSELVTNAVRHSGADDTIELRASLARGVVRVEVRDAGTGFERPAEPRSRGADGGYGLVLVERMARVWGVEHDDGARVWFELAA